MKKIITIIKNTRQVIQLLSDPNIAAMLQKRLSVQKLGQADIYNHKYYLVQVVH